MGRTSRAGAGLEQSKSGAETWAGQEQGRNRAGAELSRVKQSRAERGQELGRNWGGARNVLDRSLKGAGQEYGRGRAEAGAWEE